MKILYEDNHLLVVVKPVNVPVCEDESKDEDLLNMLKKYLKEFSRSYYRAQWLEFLNFLYERYAEELEDYLNV